MREYDGVATPKALGNKDEIDIWDIFRFVRFHFITLILFIFLGSAVGVAMYVYLPKKWESEVTLQIGKVPVLNKLEYMDAPAALVEKIKSPLFLSRALKEIYGDKIDRSSPTAQLFYRDLSVSPVRESNLITLRVFGWKPEEAYKNAEVVAKMIVTESLFTTSQYLKNAQARLNEVSVEIRLNEVILNKVNSIEQSVPTKTNADALLKLALSDGKINQLQMLQKEKARLENLISASQLQKTMVVARSLPPLSPSSPRKGLLIIGGAILGLFVGLLLSLFSQLRTRRIKDLKSSLPG